MTAPDSEPLQRALTLPSGARFYRCALQVNPFAYGERHGKKTHATEADYNRAIVEGCQANEVEVIAITDHHSIATAGSLIDAARAAGIIVFPGFEAGTKDGIHILCLFDPSRPLPEIERILGRIGIVKSDEHTPICELNLRDLLHEADKQRFLCIAAHAEQTSGILVHRAGAARMADWVEPSLLACIIQGTVDELPDGLRPIVRNQDRQHLRTMPMAVLNACDVRTADDLAKSNATTWIKMSSVSLEGLRQAFLEKDSRIRLNSEQVPEPHSKILAISWTGSSLLDGAAIHWNENLNVLIGGRGTGKSTIVESLRYAFALDPLGEEARRNHDGIVKSVLQAGTTVSVLVETHQPDRRVHRIERTVPNPPIVRDAANGQVLTQSPSDVLPGIEIYGQHEISELTKSPEKRTRLLHRFMKPNPELKRERDAVKKQLERSRRQLVDARRELGQLDERLASMPRLEEILRRFQEAGLEDKLRERSLLVREEQIFKTVQARLAPVGEALETLQRLSIDHAFVSPRALDPLPGKVTLEALGPIFAKLNAGLSAVATALERELGQAQEGVGRVRDEWNERRRVVQLEYEKLLRELQRTKVDGDELIQVRQQIEELRPLMERRPQLEREIREVEGARRNQVAAWEAIASQRFRELDRAAKAVSGQLRASVRISVVAGGNRAPLRELLGRHLQGRTSELIKAVEKARDLSLRGLVEACRQGRAVVAQKLELPPAQAEKVATLPEEALMEIEELELPSTTQIELNVGKDGQEQWRPLDELSTGQKATAVLLLLLLDSSAPLVVDQPEDDLDNRFITDGVVPRMKDEKQRRQFIFATHNANIPVLGDAELIVGLRPASEGTAIPLEQMGSIDSHEVQKMVEEILEGGREAFETRRLKYGFSRR